MTIRNSLANEIKNLYTFPNLGLYGQIYHPEKEVIIDAFKLSNEIAGISFVYNTPQF